MFSGDECGWNYVISLKLYKNMKMKSLIFFDVQFAECVCVEMRFAWKVC